MRVHAKNTNWTQFGPVRARVSPFQSSFHCFQIVKPYSIVPGTKKVTKAQVQLKFENKNVTLNHILYSGWPDHAVAESHKHAARSELLSTSSTIASPSSFTALPESVSHLVVDFQFHFQVALAHSSQSRWSRTKSSRNSKEPSRWSTSCRLSESSELWRCRTTRQVIPSSTVHSPFSAILFRLPMRVGDLACGGGTCEERRGHRVDSVVRRHAGPQEEEGTNVWKHVGQEIL